MEVLDQHHEKESGPGNDVGVKPAVVIDLELVEEDPSVLDPDKDLEELLILADITIETD